MRSWAWGLIPLALCCAGCGEDDSSTQATGGGTNGGTGGGAASGGASGTGGNAGSGGAAEAGSDSGGASTTDTCPTIEDIAAPETAVENFPLGNGLMAVGDALYLANGADEIVRWREGMSALEVVATGPADRPLAVVGDTLYYESSGFLFAASLAAIPAAGTQVSSEPVPSLSSTAWACDDEALYFAEYSVGTVRRVPFDGSAGSDLAQATGPVKLVTAGGFVYYNDYLGFNEGFRRVPTAGGADELATAGEAELFTDFATDGTLFWIAEQPRLRRSSVGGTEQHPPIVSEATGPTFGQWMDNLKMVGDTLYLEHTKGGCARVTADGTCRIISESFDGSSYAILGDYIYYVTFGTGRVLKRFSR
jgi:hypothetical protein